ncbi:MAG: hypothetical protein ACR2QW_00220, partial [bacterium]
TGSRVGSNHSRFVVAPYKLVKYVAAILASTLQPNRGFATLQGVIFLMGKKLPAFGSKISPILAKC